MPPAKKTPARKSTRSTNASSGTGPISRKEVEAAVARFDKALDEATKALTTMRQDLGKGARSAYKDVAAALTALRRDATKTNRAVIKDLEKLRASVTSAAKSSARSTSRASAAKTSRSTAKSTAKKASSARASRKPAASAARKPAARSGAKRSTTAKRATSK
jgi:phosphoenolpyruvate-protein kinase (PTS system EI component)